MYSTSTGEKNEDSKNLQRTKSFDQFDTSWVTEHARQVNNKHRKQG